MTVLHIRFVIFEPVNEVLNDIHRRATSPLFVVLVSDGFQHILQVRYYVVEGDFIQRPIWQCELWTKAQNDFRLRRQRLGSGVVNSFSIHCDVFRIAMLSRGREKSFEFAFRDGGCRGDVGIKEIVLIREEILRDRWWNGGRNGLLEVSPHISELLDAMVRLTDLDVQQRSLELFNTLL